MTRQKQRGVGFDMDGTLTRPFTAIVYPEVADLIRAVREERDPAIFVATNQAGSVYRAITGDPKYPTAVMLAEQIVTVAAALDLDMVPWFIATWHGRRETWESAAPESAAWALESVAQSSLLRAAIKQCDPALEVYVSGSPEWRKPGYGMLEAAVERLKIEYSTLLYVGDLQSDADAAHSYGVTFVDAVRWRSGMVTL